MPLHAGYQRLHAARNEFERRAQERILPFLVTWFGTKCGTPEEVSEPKIEAALTKLLSSRAVREAEWGRRGVVRYLALEVLVALGLPADTCDLKAADDRQVLGQSRDAWFASLRLADGQWQEEARRFYAELYPQVRAALARGWPSHPDLDEAAHLALVKFLCGAMGQYDPKQLGLVPYLLRAAGWALSDLHSAPDRTPQPLGEDHRAAPRPDPSVRELRDSDGSPDRHPLAAEFADTLEDPDRTIFRMEAERRPRAEIAKQVGLSQSSVCKRVQALESRFARHVGIGGDRPRRSRSGKGKNQ